MAQTVLILGGNGKIGKHASKAFEAAGWDVRYYDRQLGNMSEAAQGADVIVNGLNPPNYHNWQQIIPAITKQVIEAAKLSGATVIIPGNVYNFGDNPGLWDENTPHRPNSRKGKIRVDMENAYRASEVQTIVLRAGNFIDPNKEKDIFSMLLVPSLGKGKVSFPGNPDAMQAYCYLPDWAKAAVLLAERREQLSSFEDVPFGGLAFSANELKSTLEQMMGKKLRMGGFVWPLMRIAAPFWELARELLEMRYLWNTDHQLGTSRLEELLPDFKLTNLHDVLTDVLPDQINPHDAMPRNVRVAVAD